MEEKRDVFAKRSEQLRGAILTHREEGTEEGDRVAASYRAVDVRSVENVPEEYRETREARGTRDTQEAHNLHRGGEQKLALRPPLHRTARPPPEGPRIASVNSGIGGKGEFDNLIDSAIATALSPKKNLDPRVGERAGGGSGVGAVAAVHGYPMSKQSAVGAARATANAPGEGARTAVDSSGWAEDGEVELIELPLPASRSPGSSPDAKIKSKSAAASGAGQRRKPAPAWSLAPDRAKVPNPKT